ncbi:hypothetical protein FIM10_04265 [Sphingomonadales bacterium 56]|uniref:Uncharacterized protein n=1 Tax=Sphingobium agri TaxID=2933566 RepID=A0ABT0DWP0_9SPHN|nr:MULTISPECIES: hypothetical protein [Sphingobium]MBY2927891.1 hypothetical protein [Sphingomonadales bacterium 56]MBY2957991.1 hypothetical protein [Sphingomonadales bacterium 58]MCK0531357.1 hypothetical protein [Sphingobium agri]CAD7336150.1 hypothetical protein SPHS6_00866 [Sphingobium sp. S6]CAD7336213.1 hypothetical protein SPHS8_00906 [Sphingobium sp. S8]
MRLIACLAALSLSAPALAADPCLDAPLPPEPWTSWNQSGTESAAGEAASAPRLILGKPLVATLRPSPQVQYAVKPHHQAPKSYGGLFSLAVKTPARIGIGLSGPAWVDIVFRNSPIASTAHSHGPGCSGIRKIVWFDLTPGVHLIQLSGAASSQVRIMAADARANQPLPPVQDR